MQRTIRGFHQDDVGDWVAELDCGHTQHMRHKPPWENRAWVVTEQGRAQKLGQALECSLCPAPELPSGAVAYRRTGEFTERTIPDGLKREHRTKRGVWATVVVEAGKLRLVLEGAPGHVRMLVPGSRAVIAPEAPHHVEAIGPVRFYVEFWRDATLPNENTG
jgi:tellurite methyltransferase